MGQRRVEDPHAPVPLLVFFISAQGFPGRPGAWSSHWALPPLANSGAASEARSRGGGPASYRIWWRDIQPLPAATSDFSCSSRPTEVSCGAVYSGDRVHHRPKRMGQCRPLHQPPCQVFGGDRFVCPGVSCTTPLVFVESISAADAENALGVLAAPMR